jgi:hypothetical protein
MAFFHARSSHGHVFPKCSIEDILMREVDAGLIPERYEVVITNGYVVYQQSAAEIVVSAGQYLEQG